MPTAKANPDDLVHEPSRLFVVSERTLRTIAEGALSADDVIADLDQDNFAQVEILEGAKVNLFKPPF